MRQRAHKEHAAACFFSCATLSIYSDCTLGAPRKGNFSCGWSSFSNVNPYFLKSRIYFFYTAGSRNELEGVGAVATRKLYPRKRHVFLIEKSIEDLRQDEKHVPDLLEAIIQPKDPVKD